MSRSQDGQQTLGGGVPEHARAGHLTMDASQAGGESNGLTANADRNECWCVECNSRVTIGPREYGHELTCEHSSYERGGE